MPDKLAGRVLGPPKGPWNIRTFKNPPYLKPRWQNDIVRLIEEEFVPISPSTHQVEEEYQSEHGGLHMQDCQLRFFNHVFTPIRVGKNYRLPYTTVVYSDLKKSGKTAIQAAFFMAYSRLFGGELFFCTNSREQSRDRAYWRVYQWLSYLQRTNEAKYEEICTRQDIEWIELQNPYASIRPLPVAPGTSAGAFQSVTGWDELWDYDREAAIRLYSEMQPIPTIPDVTIPDGFIDAGKTIVAPGLRFISTYVGYYGESSLLWAIYEETVNEDPDTQQARGKRIKGLEDLPCFVSEDGQTAAYWNQDTPRMPWQTPEFIERARKDPLNKLRPEEFRRLWQNRWSSGNESFIDMALVRDSMQRGKERGLYNVHPV